MSDFSTFALFTAGLAVFAPLVSAHTKEAIKVPGGSDPTGPALYQPNLNVVVAAGTQFSITWSKDGQDACGKKVDLVLLKGPSSNAMNAISYIAQGVENSGSYAWKPSTDLEPSPEDYGIELVCQKNQAYQYTPRFGISNDKYVPGSDDHSSSSNSSVSSSAAASASSSQGSAVPKYPVATGGASYGNGTQPKPTGSMTVPDTLTTSATATGGAITTTATRGSSGSQSSGSGSSSSATQASQGAAAAMQTGVSGLIAAAAIAAIAL